MNKYLLKRKTEKEILQRKYGNIFVAQYEVKTPKNEKSSHEQLALGNRNVCPPLHGY